MDEFGRSDIFYTIVDNDYESFLRELSRLKNINIVDINACSLLHFCSEYSRLNFAERLLERKIDLELKDKHGNTALWTATFNARGNYELLQLLLEHEANPHSKNKVNRSPLDFAIIKGDERLMGLLSAPPFSYYAAWEELAERFNYSIDPKEQDWTYVIAEPERIEDYLSAYEELDSKEAKFSLMEMILQALNGQDEEDVEKYGKTVKDLLDRDFDLHEYTIYYWCVWENDNLEESFWISGHMRKYWIQKVRSKYS
ncbi:MAG: ankyrin repeat domain-containing protein [Bacteroidota bacterium]